METSSNPLNLRDALLLYDLIGKHIPKNVDENTDVLSFVDGIISSIISANEHKKYVEAIMLMNGMTQKEVLSKSIDDAVMLFSEGLISNHVLLLCKFCEDLGYGTP